MGKGGHERNSISSRIRSMNGWHPLMGKMNWAGKGHTVGFSAVGGGGGGVLAPLGAPLLCVSWADGCGLWQWTCRCFPLDLLACVLVWCGGALGMDWCRWMRCVLMCVGASNADAKRHVCPLAYGVCTSQWMDGPWNGHVTSEDEMDGCTWTSYVQWMMTWVYLSRGWWHGCTYPGDGGMGIPIQWMVTWVYLSSG